MSRCIIHVGMHKTGTSSIQRSLNGFEDASFVYADADGHPNHSRVLFEMLEFELPDRNGKEPRVAAKKPGADTVARLRQSMARAGGRTLLISGEGVSLLPKGELARLRELLSESFDEITIVAAVRAPASYMASVFQGPVRNGMRNYIDIRYRGYQRTFSKFDEVFGRDNVRLWKFDPKSYPGGCAVRDFCGRLGIALASERIVRVNESLSREALGLLFTYRTFAAEMGVTEMTGPQNRRLLAELLKIGNTRFRFSPDLVRPILEDKRADIEWMEARLGQSLDEALGEPRLEDVRDESDFLRPDPRAVSQLLELLGDAAPKGIGGETPEQVARLVHALRQKESLHKSSPRKRGSSKNLFTLDSRLRGNDEKRLLQSFQNSVRHGDRQMKVTELIEEIPKTQPKVLDGIDEKTAADLVRHVFKHINDTLAGMGEGVVKYAGLGRFRVRRMKKEVEGKKIDRTQIVFRALPGGGKGDDGAED